MYCAIKWNSSTQALGYLRQAVGHSLKAMQNEKN